LLGDKDGNIAEPVIQSSDEMTGQTNVVNR
jgi:hypothetical protein